MNRILPTRKPVSAARHVEEPLSIASEAEPYRQDWLRLTPGERILRVWRMRRRLSAETLEAAHNALSLPRL
ncbi:MAG: hypothetical protein HYY93_14865 [Planctomycetes bacterium]|nr:hypothetical protein [Planctomycetota bacterium]